MQLFLFTNTFPFKKAEPFLINEFEFTKKYFESISVLSFYGEVKDSYFGPDEQIKLMKPILNSPAEKNKIFTKGIFNFSGCKFHIHEFFQKRIFLSPEKIYWFITSLLITRMILSSRSFKDMLNNIRNAPDPVLYFYWADNLCWALPYLKKKLQNKNCKVIIRLHRADLYEDLKDNYAPLRNQIFSLADIIVPVSLDGKDYLLEKYPNIKNKLFLSRLGVFDHGLNPINLEQVKCIVSVSNLVEVKRVHLIFETLQKMRTNVIWYHFGDGPQGEALKNSIKYKRANLEVVLPGFVNNIDLMRFYQTHPVDLLLNVSESEGLPVSIMEALSFGIPVIATNVGGTAELVDEHVGKLIEIDFSTSDLANDIKKLLSLELNRIEVLRKNARNYFENKVNATVNYPGFYKFILHSFHGSSPL